MGLTVSGYPASTVTPPALIVSVFAVTHAAKISGQFLARMVALPVRFLGVYCSYFSLDVRLVPLPKLVSRQPLVVLCSLARMFLEPQRLQFLITFGYTFLGGHRLERLA